jgi:hypothetical protein
VSSSISKFWEGEVAGFSKLGKNVMLLQSTPRASQYLMTEWGKKKMTV